MRRKLSYLLSALLVVALCMPFSAAAATTVKFDPGSSSTTTSLTSSEAAKSTHDYLTLTTSGTKITIQGETTIKPTTTNGELKQPNLNMQKVGKNGKSTWIGYLDIAKSGSYYTLSGTFDVKSFKWNGTGSLANGTYLVLITYPKAGVKSEKTFVLYKNAYVKVSTSSAKLLKWQKVIDKTNAVRNAAVDDSSKYTEPAMGDLYNTGCGAPFTTKEVNYIAKVADEVAGDAETPAEKAKCIYEYIADNFYYDDYAFDNPATVSQYCDVYDNLYNLRNKKKSANSTAKGQVATTCVGDAGLVAALARAEGIPARIANGHHLGLGASNKNTWNTEENVGTIDHWWAELYIDGAWRVVDPTAGSGNHWTRKSATGAGTWAKQGTTSYASFLPTDEQLATTYVTYNIFGGEMPAITAAPKAPKATNVAKTGKVKLTWTGVTGAKWYEVWRSTTGKSGSFTLLGTTTSKTMTHNKGTAGTKYWYKLRALNKARKPSGYSSATARTCDYAQPSVKGTNVAKTGKVKINWNKVTGAKKYQVYRATSSSGKFTLLGTTTGKTWTHSKGTAGKAYWYKVRAIGKSGAASAYSAKVKRTCDYAQPKAPKATNAKSGKVKLTWKKVTGAKKYQVWYSKTGKKGSFKLLYTTKAKSMTHKKGVKGKTYWYKVRATGNSGAASAYSPVVKRKCR